MISNERKYMTDKEVLERYINLDNSCLNQMGKEGSKEFDFTNIRMHLV